MRPVTVIGSVNMDLVAFVDAFPHPGETRLGSGYERHHGGKGANQAVAAARMGATVQFVGRTGAESFGHELKHAVASEGIDVTQLRDAAEPTGAAFIAVNSQAENIIIVAPGANHRLQAEDLDTNLFREGGIVLLQLEILLDTVQRAIVLAKQAGSFVVVNAAPATAVKLDGLEGADLIIVNEEEAYTMLGMPGSELGVERAVEKLAEFYPNVVITLGKQGAMWRTPRDNGRMAAFPVNAIDTTGAGDAFVGSLVAGLARHVDWYGAVRQASAAAALAVTRRGAQSSLPYQTEVDQFLAAQTRSDHVGNN